VLFLASRHQLHESKRYLPATTILEYATIANYMMKVLQSKLGCYSLLSGVPANIKSAQSKSFATFHL